MGLIFASPLPFDFPPGGLRKNSSSRRKNAKCEILYCPYPYPIATAGLGGEIVVGGEQYIRAEGVIKATPTHPRHGMRPRTSAN